MRLRLPIICLIIFLLWISATASCQELYRMPAGVVSGMGSFENPTAAKGAGGASNRGAKGDAFSCLRAGESKSLLMLTGPGIIQRMWFTFRDRSPEMLRALHLQIFWDGSTKPAIDAPFGDFFGAGLGRVTAFESALFSSPEGRSFNCYIPMPFKKGARLVLTNESGSDLDLLFYDIDFVRLSSPPPDMLYFHAYWHRRSSGTLGTDFELLPRVKGKGRFLGVNIGVITDSAYGRAWFGEGEVKMYIDGDTNHPTINGTGTEDYIGTGWGQGVFTHLYQGCTLADEACGQYAFYRLHIPDQIWFHHDCKVTIQQIGGAEPDLVRSLQNKGALLKEISVATDTNLIRLLDEPDPPSLQSPVFPKGWVNFYRVDDISATAYFYLNAPISPLPAIAGTNERER